MDASRLQYSIDNLGRYCMHMHAHNYTSITALGDLLPLEKGVMSYPEILSSLLDIGYDGYVFN